MPSATEPALFLDTSIQIARQVHGPRTKKAITARLSQHPKIVTSLIVRQEYKRRLLKEAEYLLRQLHRYQSFDEVHQHVIRLFGPWHDRKRNICLQTLAQVHGGADADRTERLQLFLRSLLVAGLRRFDQMVDEVRKDSGCACARHDVVEKVKLRKYYLGPERCNRTIQGACGIVAFLKSRRESCERILEKLRALPAEEKSAALRNAQQFLERWLKNPEKAREEDPCLQVGDLMIAIESADMPNFFTLNSVESQHLCRALGQTLIVRPIDPLKSETVCHKDDPHWPKFGKKINPER